VIFAGYRTVWTAFQNVVDIVAILQMYVADEVGVCERASDGGRLLYTPMS
jgi:hypothetical protein